MRAGDQRPRRPRGRDPARRRGRLEQWVHLSQGCRAGRAARRSRSPADAADPRRTHVARGVVDGGVRGSGAPPPTGHRATRPGRGRRLHRQSHRPQFLPRPLRPGVHRPRRPAPHLLGGHRRSVAEERRRGPHVRRHVVDPGARPRPHRLPADARRQPLRVAGQPARRARRARPPRRHPRSRRPRGADRSAAHRYRGARRRVAAHPPRHRRAAAAGDGPRPLRRGSDRPRRARRHRHRRRRRARAGERIPARGGGGGVCDSRRDHAPAGARAGRRADCRRLRAHRHLHAGVRHARVMAGRSAEHPQRQSRPPGWLAVRKPGGVADEHAAAARPATRLAAASLAQPRARCPRGARPGAAELLGGGDRHAGPRPECGR